jgi:DNA-binding MarR family transcriptional regulator
MDPEQIPDSRSPSGELITELINEVFLLNGKLLRAGDALTADVGLTSARWQVLGSLSGDPATTAQIARRRGLRRQSVQEVVQRLRVDGLVDTRPNPQDRRAPLIVLTPRAAEILHWLRPVQARWVDDLANACTASELAAAVHVLTAIRTTIAAQLDGDTPGAS